MNSRGTAITKPAPGPFHCVACKTYVTGTPSGHCPRCGWVPPIATSLAPPAARIPRVLVLSVVVVVVVAIAVLR